MKKKTAATVLAAGILAGAGTALTVPGTALAAGSSTSVTDRAADRINAIKDALKGLVGNGTITQTQADKVATTLAQSHLGFGRHGHGRFLPPEAVAQVLGMTPQQLHDAADSGKTLTQIAATKGISRTDLISKLVAAAKTQLAADLQAGRLTQAQYDNALSTLQARISERVDRPAGMHRGPGMGGPGDGDGDGPDGGPGAGPMTASPAPTTAG